MFSFKHIDIVKVKKQSYLDLLKERGMTCCFENAIFTIVMFYVNEYIFSTQWHISSYITMYLFFTIYDTFKPKLVVKLRQMLKAKDFENK